MLSACGPQGDLRNPTRAFELLEADIGDIQAAYDAGTLTAVELVQAYLDRINAYDDAGPALNSIISLHPDALGRAAALDDERQQTGRRGPLHGIPVLLKDNINTSISRRPMVPLFSKASSQRTMRR